MPKTKEIERLEAELARARKDARTQREPVAGIGGAIQRIRTSKGHGLCELSALSGVGKGNLSKIETTKNANPTLETLCMLSHGLGVPVAKILKEAGIE